MAVSEDALNHRIIYSEPIEIRSQPAPECVFAITHNDMTHHSRVTFECLLL